MIHISTKFDNEIEKLKDTIEQRDTLIRELVEALDAVIGHGYCEANSPLSQQDFVSKSAIKKVHKALTSAKRTP